MRQICHYIHDGPIIELMHHNVAIVLFELNAIEPEWWNIEDVSGVNYEIQEFHFEKSGFVLLLGVPHVEWRSEILIQHHVFIAAPRGHFHCQFATDHIQESAFIGVIGERRDSAVGPNQNIVIGTHTHGCLENRIHLLVLFKHAGFHDEVGIVRAVILALRVGLHKRGGSTEGERGARIFGGGIGMVVGGFFENDVEVAVFLNERR